MDATALKSVARQSNSEGDSEDLTDGYPDEDRPLGAYAGMATGFAAALAAALIAARRSGRELPERIEPWDVVLAGVATHKISRLITKEKVTSFVRAPFVRHKENKGYGEVREVPRGEGLRRAVGELLACPYCLDQWVAAGFGVGVVAAPRITRLVAFIYTTEAVGDFLQIAYRAAEDKAAAPGDNGAAR